MKEANNKGLTPINLLLEHDTPLKRIERLLSFDLIPKHCFTTCQDELIDFITRKVIKNQKEKRFQGTLVFTKPEINKKYFEVFQDELEAYSLQKESFQKRGCLKIFDDLFSVPEYELKLEGKSSIENTHASKLKWTINNETILVTQVQNNFKPRRVQS